MNLHEAIELARHAVMAELARASRVRLAGQPAPELVDVGDAVVAALNTAGALCLDDAVVRQPEEPGGHDYDRDPNAYAWARRKIQAAADRLEAQGRAAHAQGKDNQAARDKRALIWVRRNLTHGVPQRRALFDPRHCDNTPGAGQ